MTMTVEEAVRYARGGRDAREWLATHDMESADMDCMRTLAAEVERLRSECVTCSTADNWRARALPAEAEVARLNKENDDWHEASKKLREEAQTARLALDVAQKEIERLQTIIRELGETQEKAAARDLRFIEWVRLRQEWIAQVHLAYVDGGDLFKAVDELITFDLANPPPGATK